MMSWKATKPGKYNGRKYIKKYRGRVFGHRGNVIGSMPKRVELREKESNNA